MRFSLLSLFLLLTLSCVGLAMYASYGLIGLWFLVPHLAVVVGTWYCFRIRWRVVGFSSVSLYLLAWAGTYFIGVPIVMGDAAKRIFTIAQQRSISETNEKPFVRRYDSIPSAKRDSPIEKPWYYVGKGTSPCPLVVTLDYGHFADYGEYGGSGRGGRAFFLWGIGWTCIADQITWIMIG